MKLRILAVGVVIGMAAAAGCGGASVKDTTTAPPTTPASYETTYVAIMDPLTQAIGAIPQTHTSAELAAMVNQAAAQLRAVRWPPSAGGDVHALEQAMAPYAADLQTGDSSLLHDASNIDAAANTVRHDLGLPPSS